MADFLLELFSEEIPARMQVDAARHLQKAFVDAMGAAGLTCDPIQTYVTPRRVALIGKNIPAIQPDINQEKKGPKTSAPQAAIDGFLKSSGLTLDKLEKRMVGKDETYFAVIHQKGQPTATILKTIVEKIMAEFPWPKSMRWGSGEKSWVRPLHSILCLFEGKVVPVEFAGIKASNITLGHRFLAPDVITIHSPDDYVNALKAAKVIADHDERKSVILKQAETMATEKGLTLKRDDGLVNEVTGLVEWPTVLMGTIDDAFMDLPPEVLISEMRAHQKYFALLDKAGNFSNRFLIVSNMVTTDGGKAVIAGNERVLRARLSDGRFFFDQDRKKPLSDWAQGLKGVTFHAKLGTVSQKVERVAILADVIADFVKDADKALVKRAAQLAKADLVTGMVGEFPDLQGVMGRYYALAQKEDAAVADAIRDHYLPLGPDSAIPIKPISICVALADKFDTLISMFAVGEKPTGSKDPFALRRSALGIIRIILENNLRFKLNDLILNYLNSVDISKYNPDFPKLKIETNYNAPNVDEGFIYKRNQTELLINFFADRLAVQLKDKGIRHDVIKAIMASGDDDLVRVVARAKTLENFLKSEDGANLLVAYKRAANIVDQAEKKDGIKYESQIRPALLKDDYEKNLDEALTSSREKIKTCQKAEKFEEAMGHAAYLREPIDAFFANVFINDENNKDLKINRLGMLAWIRDIFNVLADFSLIEG